MKLRTSFVSNSSSSSFVIALNKLSENDLIALQNYMSDPDLNTDGWNGYVEDDKGVYSAFTSMDNNHLDEWVEKNLPHIKKLMVYQSY